MTATGLALLWLIVAVELLLVSLFWLMTSQLWRSRQKPEFLWLAAGNGLLGIGLFLVSRRAELPDIVTVVLANSLELFAFACLWHGSALLFRQKFRREPFVIAGVGSAVILVLHWAGTSYEYLREATVFFFIALILLRAGWLTQVEDDNSFNRQNNKKFAQFICIITFVAGVLLVLQGISTLLRGAPMDALRPSVDSYIIVCSALLGMTVGNCVLAYAVLRGLIQELANAAYFDSLTGLPNRRAFFEQLSNFWLKWRREGTEFALLCLDLDHFKRVNDTFGAKCGDSVLQIVADALRQHARPSDKVTRLEEEGFAVVLAGVNDPDVAMEVADRLRKAVAEAALPGKMKSWDLRISAGVAMVSASDLDFQGILSRAECALHAAKAQGRNRSCLYPVEVPAVETGWLKAS